jgi:AhpD family alkylhydroperoxidase
VTPRIAPGDRRDVGLLNWAIAAVSGRVAGTGPPNLFMTLGRNRGLYRGWLHFAGRLMPGGRLPRRETELVILRVAHLSNCHYEFDHHRHLAQRAGITDAEIDRLMADPTSPAWPDRERALLAACDELLAKGDLSDAAWQALSDHYSQRLLIEVLLLIGHYQMLAGVISALRIEPDARR